MSLTLFGHINVINRVSINILSTVFVYSSGEAAQSFSCSTQMMEGDRERDVGLNRRKRKDEGRCYEYSSFS